MRTRLVRRNIGVILKSDIFEDREYRKGVHWLETLRLRRTKILESGYKVIHIHT